MDEIQTKVLTIFLLAIHSLTIKDHFKSREIREKRFGTAMEINGKCNTKTRSEWNCSRGLKLQLKK